MTPALSPDDVRRIAALARLELDAADVELLSHQLAAILDYAGAIKDIDTAGVPPTSQALAAGPAWRDDTPVESLRREDVIAASPAADPAAGLFKVPKVL